MTSKEDRVRETFGGVVPIILGAVESAFDEVKEDLLHKVLWRSKVAASILLNEAMVRHCRIAFDGHPEVTIRELPRLVIFSVLSETYHEEYIFRLKKVNARNLSSFVPTRQAKMFYEQMSFGFYPKEVHLVLGYFVDPTYSRLERVSLTCPNGAKANEFVIDLDELFWNQTQTSIIQTIRPEPTEILKNRIRAKGVNYGSNQNRERKGGAGQS